MIDVSAWPGLRLVRRIEEGNRNEVWQGEIDEQLLAVRRSRRSVASLDWELNLLETVGAAGFLVPMPVLAGNGQRSVDGVVVQRWIEGAEPNSEHDWKAVAAELQRMHALLAGYPQRPGCCTIRELQTTRRSVDADLDALPLEVQIQIVDVFDEFDGVAISLIHGDPNPSNLRIVDGVVGFLDWDESRVDLVWHDLSNLGIAVLNSDDHRRAERLSNAWEAVNGWVEEPGYARRRLAEL